MEIEHYSKVALETVKQCNFLTSDDFASLQEMQEELQETFEKKQIWRTETEMRVSVLNDIKFPTSASKYWQCVREQSVFFENLIILSFDYKRNNVQIKKNMRELTNIMDDLDKELKQIDLEECLFKKKNMELAAKDRMREIRLWSQIKHELNDGTFDEKNVNTHQLISYGQRFLLQYTQLKKSNSSISEANNITGQLRTVLKIAHERGVINEIISVLPEQQQKLFLEVNKDV